MKVNKTLTQILACIFVFNFCLFFFVCVKAIKFGALFGQLKNQTESQISPKY